MNDHMLLRKTEEIRQALESGLYNCALTMALTLPDICGKVEFSTERDSARYKKWFEKYAKEYFTNSTIVLPEEYVTTYQWLNADECYALRCAVLHAGNYKTQAKSKLSKVTLHAHKRGNENYSHMIRDSRFADLDVISLCKTLCNSVETYYNSIEDKSKFDIDEVRIDTW